MINIRGAAWLHVSTSISTRASIISVLLAIMGPICHIAAWTSYFACSEPIRNVVFICKLSN